MQELEGAPLHQSKLAGVRLACPPELSASIKDYFKSNGFDVSNTVCFSNNAPDRLNLIFEVATQARKLAGVIMGWICPYISRHLLSLNPLLACCRRYSRG
ncbi:hypothetical protein NP180_23175, partial [Salmonella enterica]|nr:hypothetical protein [Salmonella enterica]